MTRLLYFTEADSPHDQRFLKALATSRYQVYALRLLAGTTPQTPAGITEVAWQGGKKPFRWHEVPRLVADFKKILAVVKPDLIHAGPIQKPALIAALAGFHPLVSMSWGSDLLLDAQKNAFWRGITRFTLHRSDVFIGDCEAVAASAVNFGFPREHVFLFPWGVELERFLHVSQQTHAQALRHQLGWDDCFVIYCNRSFEAVYGVDVLVKAFALAAARDENLRLLLAGDGSQRTLIHHLVAESGVADRVHFIGRVGLDELPVLYKSADLYISPSHSDGSSVSLMEALASALPVLVTDIPANREWVKPGINGWLFEDGNPAHLAEMILQAMRSPNLDAMRANNRQLALDRADWQKNVQRLYAAYQHALKGMQAQQ